MHAFKLIVALAFLALAVYIFVTVYVQYLANSDKTGFERWRATAQGSATLLWSKFCLLVAGLVGSLDTLADMVGQPEAKEWIQTIIGNPKIVATAILGISIVTIIARKRTL